MAKKMLEGLSCVTLWILILSLQLIFVQRLTAFKNKVQSAWNDCKNTTFEAGSDEEGYNKLGK